MIRKLFSRNSLNIYKDVSQNNNQVEKDLRQPEKNENEKVRLKILSSQKKILNFTIYRRNHANINNMCNQTINKTLRDTNNFINNRIITLLNHTGAIIRIYKSISIH